MADRDTTPVGSGSGNEPEQAAASSGKKSKFGMKGLKGALGKMKDKANETKQKVL
jgi:hypothetical protein